MKRKILALFAVLLMLIITMSTAHASSSAFASWTRSSQGHWWSPQFGQFFVFFNNTPIAPTVFTQLDFEITDNLAWQLNYIRVNRGQYFGVDVTNPALESGNRTRMCARNAWTNLPNPVFSLEPNRGSYTINEAEVVATGHLISRWYWFDVDWRDFRSGLAFDAGRFSVNAEISTWWGWPFNEFNVLSWDGLASIPFGRNAGVQW